MLAVCGLDNLFGLIWPKDRVPNWHRSFRCLIVWAKVLVQNWCLNVLLGICKALLIELFLAFYRKSIHSARACRWHIALGRKHGWLLFRLNYYNALACLLAISGFGSLFEHSSLLIFNRLVETFCQISPRLLSHFRVESYLFQYSRTPHFLFKVHLVSNWAILYGFNYLLNLVITALLNRLILVFWWVYRR